MVLKVIHIDRMKVDLENEVRSFVDNVLKPKWDEQARKRGEKLRAELTGEKTLTPGFPAQKAMTESGETLKIVIEVDGKKLNITCKD